MRAATLIVGAIAAASILVALAFILTPGGSTGGGTTTVVRTTVEAPRRSGGLEECGKEFSVENTSCEVGEEVRSKFEDNHLGLLIVEDPDSGEYLEFNCGEPTPVICKQAGGSATVSFG